MKMKNINGNPTVMLDTKDLNIVMSCPNCGANSNRIVHGNKKWKCLDCFKSFKVPNIVNWNNSNIENIKTFETSTNLDIVPDSELNKFLDDLPNKGVPEIKNIPEGTITDSEEIKNIIQQYKKYT